MSFFSALYMLWKVLIVIFHVNIVQLLKKKKTHTLVWVKISKVMPQIPRYLSFLLGKGGNPYASNPI